MSGTNASLVIAFDARLGNLEAQLRRVDTAMKRTDDAAKTMVSSVSSSMSRIGGVMNNFLGGLAAGATQNAFSNLTAAIVGVIEKVGALADEAAQLDLDVNSIQAFLVALQEAGGKSEQAGLALGKLNDLIGDANRGSKEAAATFIALGVSFRNADGSARNVGAVFDDIAKKIGAAGSEQEKFSIAAQVFGTRVARFIVPAIDELGGSLDRGRDKLREMGAELGAGVPQKLDELGTAFAKLGHVITASMANAIANVSPQIVAFLDWLRDRIKNAIRAIEMLPENLKRVGQTLRLVAPEAEEAARRGLASATQAQAAAQRELERANAAVAQAQANNGAGPQMVSRLNAQAEARTAVATATEAQAAAQARLREVQQSAVPPPPPVIDIPQATLPPGFVQGPLSGAARGGGGGGKTEAEREAERAAEKLKRDLEARQREVDRAAAAVRKPLEVLDAKIRETAALLRSPKGLAGAAVIEMETFTRTVQEGAEAAGRALAQDGMPLPDAIRQIREQLEAMGHASEVDWARVTKATEDGAKRTADSIKSLEDSIKELGQTAIKDFAGGVADGMIEFATSTEQADKAFSEFALSFLKGIAKMILQTLVLKAITSSLSGTGIGNILGVPAPAGVGTRMAGGAVAGGNPYLVGERGPELFVPAGGGRIVPNSEIAPSSGVTVNVINNTPAQVREESRPNSATGGRDIDLYIENVVEKGFSSGRFDQSAKTAFGVRRIGRN